jgi:hypothetical protein
MPATMPIDPGRCRRHAIVVHRARMFQLPRGCRREQHQRRRSTRDTPVAISAETSTMPPRRTTFHLVKPIEYRNTTMTTNSQYPDTRARTSVGRAWQLVTSFFSLAARSLPAAGV